MRFLITGGTGSLGNALIKLLLLNKETERIDVLSRDEFKQWEMKKLLKKDHVHFFLGDVRDKERVIKAMEKTNVVIHAAALKQIESLEEQPYEAIKTNVIGTQNVIDAAAFMGIERMILVSSDKACEPLNAYGASKLMAEKLTINASLSQGEKKTIYCAIRYGNVVDSRGSVLNLWREILSSGGHFLPLTNRKMTRFWVTLKDAAELVLSALMLGRDGDLWIPRLSAFYVEDMAKALSDTIPFMIVGERPGEKLHESLMSAEESRRASEYEKWFIIPRGAVIGENQGEYSSDTAYKLSIEDLKERLNV